MKILFTKAQEERFIEKIKKEIEKEKELESEKSKNLATIRARWNALKPGDKIMQEPCYCGEYILGEVISSPEPNRVHVAIRVLAINAPWEKASFKVGDFIYRKKTESFMKLPSTFKLK